MFAQFTSGTADVTFPNTPVKINGVFNPLAFASGTGVGANRINHAPSLQATLQETHVFSSALVNELALGYTRFDLRVNPLDQGYNTAQALGLQGANTASNTDGSGMSSLTIYWFHWIQCELSTRNCSSEYDPGLRWCHAQLRCPCHSFRF